MNKLKLFLKNISLSIAAAASICAAVFLAAEYTRQPAEISAQGSAVRKHVINTDDTAEIKQASRLFTLSEKSTALSVPEIVKKAKPSVVGISSEFSDGTVGTGTGIILTSDGCIITNAHVVQNTANGVTEISENVTAVLNDSTSCPAKILGADARTDLAVIRISDIPSPLTPAEFGSSDLLTEGETAVAIGNPLGFELYGSTTCGIISALDRRITVGGYEMTLIQTDAAINPGNSGGPLLNSCGQVIGINSSKIISEHAEGLGFAIPITAALPVIEDLIANGYVTGRPFIDISSEDVTALTAQHYGIPEGICVRFITPGSSAEKSGLETGDIIVALNGRTVSRHSQLSALLEEYSAGDAVLLQVYRPDDGINCEISVALDESRN